MADTVEKGFPNGKSTEKIGQTEPNMEANNDRNHLAHLFGAANIMGSDLGGIKSHAVSEIEPNEFEFHSNTFNASITSQSVGHTKFQDFNATLKEIDTAIAQFDNGNVSELKSNKETARATNSVQPKSSEARDTSRDVLSSTTHRVLPTWTRKKRAATGSQGVVNELLSSRKRELSEKELSSDFPSKHHQSIHNAKDDYLEVVEAVEQPRQAQ